jgi:hypothetical protein
LQGELVGEVFTKISSFCKGLNVIIQGENEVAHVLDECLYFRNTDPKYEKVQSIQTQKFGIDRRLASKPRGELEFRFHQCAIVTKSTVTIKGSVI